jgi:hypothetical protein
MNLKKRLRHLADLNRIDRENKIDDTKRVSIIHAAKNNGGLFISTSIEEAKKVERHFGFPVRSYDVNLEGYAGPFYFDPEAIEDILTKAANKIELLEQELKMAKEELQEYKDDVTDRARERGELRD